MALRRKAAKNNVEVERLIELAAFGDVRAAPVIRVFQDVLEKQKWNCGY
jgi:hypothetical protein